MYRRCPLALALVTLLCGACGDEAVDPFIEALLPDHGAAGATVDVVGERFAGTQRQVSFGGQAAQVVLWQDRRARTAVPGLAPGLTLVVVTIDGRPSNAVNFRVE